MALTPSSLFLFLRSFSPTNPNFQSRFPSLILKTLTLRHFYGSIYRTSFSTSPSSALLQSDPNFPKPTDPKTLTLSARMSFVFEQMDALEKDKETSSKDEALQRIRTWREKKQKNDETNNISELGFLGSVDSKSEENMKKDNLFTKEVEVEVVHPWPEWIELMERLVHQNYFDFRRKNEDRLIENEIDDVDLLGLNEEGLREEGIDFTRDFMTVRSACINFGRDRFDILRSLSRKDIQILVGHGCPSVDPKVVFSAKILRKHVHLDEGDVCSSCSLRNSCSRAYLLTPKEDEARTLDVMRILLTFGFEPVTGSVENKALLKLKSVKTVVRKLLHEVVKLSAIPIDPNLPPPVIKKRPPKVKQPPPPPKKRVGRDDIEMKKGDWLCPKCDFMNFAKNTVCLQCDAKRPKRQLLPGEWECPECNFLNYRRNMACFHCDHKRPPDEFMENQFQEKPRGPRTRLERAASMPGISNAWNFDFDDNESDGADVAAFEFADPPRMGEDSPLNDQAYRGSSRGFEDDSFEAGKMQRIHERSRYSDSDLRKPPSRAAGTGFDDFDDEEDDDINSYELDTSNSYPKPEVPSKNFSRVDGPSGSEDFDDSGYDKPSRMMRGREAFSGSEDDDIDEQDFDSDKELSAHRNWKSSHVSDSGRRNRNRGGSGPHRGLSFGSDDELGLNSDSDDDIDHGFTPKQNKGRIQSSNRKRLRPVDSDSEDGILFGSESDDDESGDDLQSRRNKMRGNKTRPDKRENAFGDRHQSGSAKDGRFRSNGTMNGRRKSFDDVDHDRSFGGSRRNDRGSRRDDRGSRGEANGGWRENRGGGRGSRGDDNGGWRGDRGGGRGSRGDDN
ncbi:zinc finger (Ran-binding) family protein, partial [Tasmannia lanceolata]|uniref:zinc finger (Ran-binding) family protein n=1 Tax=Tasmannia lanceolata TaxID=3420 RepID=UPI004064ADE6